LSGGLSTAAASAASTAEVFLESTATTKWVHYHFLVLPLLRMNQSADHQQCWWQRPAC
jgi:hypothetical protein